MSKGLAAGSSLCLPSLPLGGLFFTESFHEVYWTTPAVFISITLPGMLLSLPGAVLQIGEEK